MIIKSLNNPLPALVNHKQTGTNIEIAVPLKHLGNFWRNLNIPLINCEISIDLSWTDKCVVVNKAYREAKAATSKTAAVAKIESLTDVTYTITGCKVYVPAVSLSTENENKLFEMLKSGFKRTVKWNKYMSYISNQPKNNNLNYSIDPTFEKVNRLFVLSFENEDNRKSYYKYYVPNVEIKNYNVLIDGNPFFELPVKNIEETYEKILNHKKIATKRWYIIQDQNQGAYGDGTDNTSIKYDAKVIKANLCDYSDAYILITGNIENKQPELGAVAFKNCAPFKLVT